MARLSQIQDLARGVERGGLSSKGGVTLLKDALRSEDETETEAEAENNLLNHSLIPALSSCKTKQGNQNATATKISAGRISGEKASPKLIASPTTVIKPASAKKNNEKAREETAWSNLSVAVLYVSRAAIQKFIVWSESKCK
jgi:hypothetical protein